MTDSAARAVAIVGLGAILPDAHHPGQFWDNLMNRRYSIRETPPDRWSIAAYYDPDPHALDKTYSKIGGWVSDFGFDWKHFRIPPKVAAAMDASQQWAVTMAGQALADYGYPERRLNGERTAVILGTAMGGELHYMSHLRISYPEYARVLEGVEAFQHLPENTRRALLAGWQAAVDADYAPVTEDSMPGELANIVSGRVANVFNLRGPNFITDAACAASFAAVQASVDLLNRGVVDAVLTGGVDHNMHVSAFVKFCKIGALSATGTRPFGAGADGFVMGEGGALFLLKRLADAERDGDRIYAVIRGIGGSSDGKGKGITAPNPIGQRLAMQRAWEDAGLDPASATLIEAHGTSTRVGDVAEVESLSAVFEAAAPGSIALGSVKSNIGHLKAGAGAAGLLKATLAMCHQTIPPTLNAERPNPDIQFAGGPFQLATTARPWNPPDGAPRRCGVSAYGFGGTNFHLVLEEHQPGRLTRNGRLHTAAPREQGREPAEPRPAAATAPLRPILALGARTPDELKNRLDETLTRVQGGWQPRAAPEPADLRLPERLVIDFDSPAELLDRVQKAHKVMAQDNPAAWAALQAQGIYRGRGRPAGQVAFLFPGQGSQYLNMGRELIACCPVVREVFEQADRVMTPILGKPLSEYIFMEGDDPNRHFLAEMELVQTHITQPAMLAMDIALFRLLGEYGIHPDMAMGHSLGEYAALIASGSMPFEDALEAVAARGREMEAFSVEDNGWMAAVMAPYEVVQRTLAAVDGYVVAANINSYNQCVIGGASQAVEQAMAAFEQAGFQAKRIPVSHAFHTQIVAPASAPLRKVLNRLRVYPPRLRLISNVTGEFYPNEPDAIRDLLEQQVASPVQWIKGLETLYAAGARVFVEVGPKKALKGLVDDVLGKQPGVIALFTNHPKMGELATFNQALCGLYAAGLGAVQEVEIVEKPIEINKPPTADRGQQTSDNGHSNGHVTVETVKALVEQMFRAALAAAPSLVEVAQPYDRNAPPLGSVVISGTGLGLPGAEKAVMDPDNALRILKGEQLIDLIPERFRKRMLDKHITRLVKAANGNGSFETITQADEVIKLAGRPGAFSLTEEYGVPARLVEALDTTTQLAMAAGLEALREAGIPLVLAFRRTTTGKDLPDRWMLPEPLRDETGVIFASAFPGADCLTDELERYFAWQNRTDQLAALEDLRGYAAEPALLAEIDWRITGLREALAAEPYTFDRLFLFRVLSMGHSQFAEYIGARGPNTQVNAACASTTQAIALADDWIRSGRCRRVVVIAGDNVTSDRLIEWVGSGFLAVGAAAIDDCVEEAALPFDNRRHGLIMGMGACGLVIESEDAVRERGMRGIVEVLNSEYGNSAYHGSRLDVDHIAQVMNNLLTTAERRCGFHRNAIAAQTVFVSHETYTPARGGSASAEIAALRYTFGEAANEIVITNTKGFTGHAMGAGVEDVIAVKILEHGRVPPVPNHREVDPKLGALNLSRGGRYPVQYALRLAAGFGSQIALTLTRRIPGGPDRVEHRTRYQHWLDAVSGYDRAQTEVEQRVLRVQNQGAPPHSPAASTWQPGVGPMLRAPLAGDGVTPFKRLERNGTTPDREPQIAAERPQTTDRGPQTAGNGHPPAVEQPPTADRAPQAVTPAAGVVVPPTPRTAESPQTADGSPQTDDPGLPTTDAVTERILALVGQKTGYPREMLELDLDLEADLGIDTVKQAETFLAIREMFDIPRPEGLQLRDYPTLGHVIQFVYEMKPELEKTADNGPQTTAEGPQTGAPGLPNTDVVAERILGLVSDKTGYPLEMLELDLDLEADLGIDTVKQAETFLAIREMFDISRPEGLQLRDYPTLGHVIQFVYEMKPEMKPAADNQPQTVEPVPAPADIQLPTADSGLPTAPGFPRRSPAPVLLPAAQRCPPTSVTLDAASRVVVMPDRGGVGKALIHRLQSAGVTVLSLEGAEDAALTERLDSWLAEGPVQGVYWLPALDAEPDLESMKLEDWRAANQVRVKNLYTVMRRLYAAIDGPDSFLVAATRLGGLHGYGEDGAMDPLGGAVSGFVKAYGREKPNALVKVVDFADTRKTAGPAEALIDETRFAPGVVEVGYRDGARFTLTLPASELPAEAAGMRLDHDTVFLVSGAAGGITSAIVADLAAASGGTFYLLDLLPRPDAQDLDLRLYQSDREALKAKLTEQVKAAGERVTPVRIEKELQVFERQDAVLQVIAAVEAAGGTAHYTAADLRDPVGVAAVLDTIRQRHGRLDVLIHAAGIEISRSLPDKDPQQFDLVFDVKADGAFNLLHAAAGLPLGAVVVFSSVAGRFGNAGQTDYSAANDLLCKLMLHWKRRAPQTHAVAIDWTAWQGIGMAARGSIPRLMELAGIEMLPPESGVPVVRRELTRSNRSGEVVVAGKLGLLAAGETRGPEIAALNQALQAAHPAYPMLGAVSAAHLGGLEFETVLDPQQQPFLRDHAIGDTPLLPGVMGIEAFAEAAQWTAWALTGETYHLWAVEDVAFHQPFKFYRREPQTLFLNVTFQPGAEGELIGAARLVSRRMPGKAGLPVQEKEHFTARVRLGRTPLEGETTSFRAPDGLPIDAHEIYHTYFHGPAYQVLDCARVEAQQALGRWNAHLPAEIEPAGAGLLAGPRGLELLFQTAGIWELKIKQRLALPLAVGRVQVFRPLDTAPELYAQVEPLDETGFNARLVDANGILYARLEGYRTVALPPEAGF